MLPLVSELASGIVRADGSPADSCTAGLYQPGTLVAMTGLYAGDGTTPVTSPVTLDAAGRAFVRCASPLRMQVKDETNAVIFDQTVNVESMDAVRVTSTYFNNGAETNLRSVLELAGAGIGKDWTIQAGAASLGLSVKAWANGVHVDVTGEDTGGGNPVRGDGIVDCTAGIQAAIDLVGARGGGVVYFPPGTYKITAPLNVPYSNVALVGAGAGSIIKNAANTNAVVVGDALSLYYDARVSDLSITSTASTGIAVLVYGIRTTIERCSISGHATGIKVTPDAGVARVLFSDVRFTAGASSRGIQFDSGGGNFVVGCSVSGAGTGKAIEFTDNDTGLTRIIGCTVGTASTGISFTAGFAGSPCAVSSSYFGATDAIESLGGSNNIEVIGCGLRGYSTTIASGGNHTPDLSRCSTTNATIEIRGTSNGAAWTVNAPSPAPGTADLDATLVLVLKNDVVSTGWTMNAIYHLSTPPSTTNGERTTYLLRWNGSAWHEVSRSVTT